MLTLSSLCPLMMLSHLFFNFLAKQPLILSNIGHNSATFDIPTLFHNSDDLFKDRLSEMNVYLGETLPLTRSLLRNNHTSLKSKKGEFSKANLCSLYQCLFNQIFDAHDASEDVATVRKIFLGPKININTETLINGCEIHSIREAKADLDYMDHRNDLFTTFVGNLYRPDDIRSCAISQGIALKIAGCGIGYNDLCSLYENFGDIGVVAILSLPPSTQKMKRTRVLQTTGVLESILEFLKTIKNTKK